MTTKQVICCLVVIYIFLNAAKADRVAYVVRNLTTYFQCVPFPDDELCSRDVMVSAYSINQIKYTLKTIKNLKELVDGKVITENCYYAITNLTCINIARCTPERIAVDVDAAMAVCENKKTYCGEATMMSDRFNCSINRVQNIQSQNNVTRVTCKKVIDSTGTCPDLDYKLPESGLNMQKQFMDIKTDLQAMKPHVTDECYDKIRKTACLAFFNPCSNDEKYMVSFISKQECFNTIKCAPDTIRQRLPRMCEYQPDSETAKKVTFSGGREQALSLVCSVFLLSTWYFFV